jgi:hypothetical protein
VAPASGLPPGLSERKAPAPQPRAASSRGNGAIAAAPAIPAADPPKPTSPNAGSSNGSGALSSLFDGDVVAPTPPTPQRPAAPPPQKGPPWPAPVALAACREATVKLLGGGEPGPTVAPNVAASARKITALLSAGEQASIEKAGTDSHFTEVLAARVALEVATAEGTRLLSANVAAAVDPESLAALTKVADEAAARLQKEANAAIGKGEVENLQLVTAASAALSRDLLNLKETADRLRGVGAAPRLGAGALDPEVVLPGQRPRPKPPVAQQSQPIKAELRDFQGLEHKPGRAKQVLAVLLFASSIALGGYAFYFGVPHHERLAPESAGAGVERIDVEGEAALITVTQQWLAAPEANVPRLAQALRAHHVKKAVLRLPNGAAAGILDVATGKTTGMPPPPSP